ncbi:MAG: hypothetical protein QW763_02775 [Archaeoglobaceae archaeon]
MRFGHKVLVEPITLEANKTKTLKLPQDRFIQSINLMCSVTFSNSTASAVSVTRNDWLNVIKRIQIVANGNDYLINVNGMRKYLVNKYLLGTNPYGVFPDSVPGNGGSATAEFEIPLIFAINPSDPLDVSCPIPAHLTSSLFLIVDIGSAPSNLSLSGNIKVIVKEIYADANEIRTLYGNRLQNLRKLYEIELEKQITAVHSNYTFAVDLDVGSIIQKLGIFAYDANENLSDSIISEYRIKQESPIDLILEDITFKASKAEDKRRYKLESLEPGFTIYDAEFKTGGLDTRGMKTGDIKFLANTTATGKVVLCHREIV